MKYIKEYIVKQKIKDNRKKKYKFGPSKNLI